MPIQLTVRSQPLKTIPSAALICALAAMALSGCGSKTDANEANFRAALNQYLEKKGTLCIGTTTWPVEVRERDARARLPLAIEKIQQMEALKRAGLVTSEELDVDLLDYNSKPTGKKVHVRHYSLTDAARPYSRHSKVNMLVGLNEYRLEQRTDLCWGQKVVDKIVKWEGPMKSGDYQEASVTFTYRIETMSEWAKRDEVQAAFREMQEQIDSAGKKSLRRGVKLTSIGWEAKGLD